MLKLALVTKRSNQFWLVGFLVGLCVCNLSSQVWGAGCTHLDTISNVSHGLDPFGSPLAKNVFKVYEGGEFRYYVMP